MSNTKARIDRILAAAVGTAAFVFLLVWAFPGLHPNIWADATVAAGLVPQTSVLPCIGNALGRILFAALPFGAAMTVYTLLGKLAIFVSAFFVYFVISGMLTQFARGSERDLTRRRTAVRLAAVVGSAAFAFSEPVWQAAQGFTSATFVILISTATLFLTIRFLVSARVSRAIGALALCGLLAAETPLGWLVLILGIVIVLLYLRGALNRSWSVFLDPMHIQRTKWILTFVFILSFVFSAFLEMVAFALMDGLKANGTTAGDLPVVYIATYWDTLVSYVAPLCLAVFLGVLALPLTLAVVMLAPATDEDRFLSFKYCIIYLLSGAIAYLQLSPFDVTWYWHYGAFMPESVKLFGTIVSAATLALAMFVLGVEVFCRDYDHIESVLNQRERDAVIAATRDFASVESVRLTFGRLCALIIPIALVAICVLGRRLVNDRELCGTLNDFVKETVEECSGLHYLFTDGSCDALIRLEAKRRGMDLMPVSLMSGKSRYEAYLRQLNTDNFEDRMTLETGAAEALRTWVVSKSANLSETAVQLAFELFRIDRRLAPIVYGAVVRPTGGDAKVALAAVERCHKLADRIVAIHETGVWRHAKDRHLKDLFLFGQFRLAVMSRLRAVMLDAEKNVKDSIAEIAFSDRLNANNPSLVKILRRMDWVRRQTGEALTPREGLEVALKRADFVMARRYAMPVLKDDPDEPDANFAVGMSYYAEEQFAKAEEYLLRVLKRHPKEAAVYNNVALICLKTGRLEEAQKNAAKALELAPDVAEVKDTVQQIEKAKSERATRGKRKK